MDKEKVEKIVGDFLLAFGQENANFSVAATEDTVSVSLQSEQSGRLIGYHGETLQALQHVLSLLVSNEFPGVRTIIDVNDYKVMQEQALRNLAIKSAQDAKFSGQPIALRPMSGYERLIVHTALNNLSDIETISEGEGDSRHIIVRPKLKSA